MAYDELIVKDAASSKIIEVMVRDSTTGMGKTGLAYGSMTGSYCREGATRQAISVIAGTVGDAYSSGKWCEVDSTNQKGLYQFHIPNAALATGVNAVTITLQATGMIDKVVRILLIDANLRDGVHLGLTALPNATPAGAGGLPTVDASNYVGGVSGNVTGSVGSVSGDTKQTGDAYAEAVLVHTHVGTIDGHITADYGSTEKAAIDLLDDASGGLADIHTDVGTAITNIAGVAAAVWAVGTRTLSSFGSLITDIWASATRALTDKAGFSISGTKTTLDALNDLSSAGAQSAATAALNAYDPPTRTEATSDKDAIITEVNANETKLDTIAGYLDTEVAAILADTNELQTDWHGGGRLDLILDAASAPSAAIVADAVWDETSSGHTGAGKAGAQLWTAIDALSVGAGVGEIDVTETVTLDGNAVANAWVGYYTDSGHTTLAASGLTNSSGIVTLHLDAGTYYMRTEIPGQPTRTETRVVS